MTLETLKEALVVDLNNEFVSSTALLDRLGIVNEDTRLSSSYVDNKYMPFYYHLGKHLKPSNLLEIGFGLGLASCCFLKSSQQVENFLSFQQADSGFYSPKLAMKNVKNVYKNKFDLYIGKIIDQAFDEKLTKIAWDVALLNEDQEYDDQLFTLELVWSRMNLEGVIAIDKVNSSKTTKSAYLNFCKIHNYTPVVVPTRYGTGLIQR